MLQRVTLPRVALCRVPCHSKTCGILQTVLRCQAQGMCADDIVQHLAALAKAKAKVKVKVKAKAKVKETYLIAWLRSKLRIG